ncbi:DEAD/DEAH box helicase family protein [Bacteroidia bacterium]|nr:DEAD/DEAH box helicase family protein [Bacteroidia bacterium]
MQFTNWAGTYRYLSQADNQTKGELFEQITERFLRWSPKYSAILKEVWRMNDLPNKVLNNLGIPSQDQGIDLIAETHEGKYWAIQCKYHGDSTRKISHREISTFLALSNSVANGIDFCLVATTADDYAKLYKGQSNIGFLLSDTWEALGKDFFKGFGEKELSKPSVRKPRPHQKEAINEAKSYFKKEDRGKLIFPCGAGKSLTGYWICNELKAKTILVAVPSLALVKQTLEDYCQESYAEGNPIDPFCICSDEGIGRNDDVAVFTQDLGVPCTTEVDRIKTFLANKSSRKKVVFTTYQSGRVLSEAVNEIGFAFDLGIMDESHKTVGAQGKLFGHLLFDENVSIKKRIFMTATERRYKGKSNSILSMDDEEVYGNTFTQLSFKDAIQQEILSDYKILTLVVSKDEIKKYLNQNDFVKALGLDWEKDIDFRTLSSLVALRKAMKKFPIKHAVTFHSSIKRAKIFEQLQPIFEKAFPDFEGIESYHVTGAIPTAQRSRIIHEFAQSERSIITNAKCLTEGVDVPSIDCVLFADPRKSTIDIVQAVGRALRRNKNKEFGYVLLPVYTESTDKESIIESEDFQAILQTLRALASNDERIIEYFRDKQNNQEREADNRLIQFDIDEISAELVNADDLIENIELKAWSRLAKLSWRPFEEAREFVGGIGLGSRDQYLDYVITNKIFDLPLATEKVYGKNWTSWPDFLNTRRITESNKLSYIEAKHIVQKYKFKTQHQFYKWVKKQVEYKIPLSPHSAYENEGWTDWGAFLGNTKTRNYKDFTVAKDWAKNSGIKSAKEWKLTKKRNELPEGIPGHPQAVYRGKGWLGWADFLDTENHKGINYLEFEKAREYIRLQNLKNTSEWKKWSKVHRPTNIPGRPDSIYKEKGWISWADFLGAEIISRNNKLNYDEAKSVIKPLGIKSSMQWREYASSTLRPETIPSNPDRHYKNKGWKGWDDFLGKTDK